jgi:hypothetical protein
MLQEDSVPQMFQKLLPKQIYFEFVVTTVFSVPKLFFLPNRDLPEFGFFRYLAATINSINITATPAIRCWCRR